MKQTKKMGVQSIHWCAAQPWTKQQHIFTHYHWLIQGLGFSAVQNYFFVSCLNYSLCTLQSITILYRFFYLTFLTRLPAGALTFLNLGKFTTSMNRVIFLCFISLQLCLSLKPFVLFLNYVFSSLIIIQYIHVAI